LKSATFVILAALMVALGSLSPRSADASPQRVVDDLGRVIVLPHGAQRILALDPSSAEILFAVGAGSRVVATSSYSNYPPASGAVPKINSLQPNLE
jgi:iron complex transport system substrate-binding protein